MRQFAFLSLIALLLFAAKSSACTCVDFASAQQAAQEDDAIVARVRTQRINRQGVGRLSVDKVYKGAIGRDEITVTGGNGDNCYAEILSQSEPWIIIMTKDKGRYKTMSCAQSTLQFAPGRQRIVYRFDEEREVELTERQFRDVIEYRVQPTVKGLNCGVELRRNFTGEDEATKQRYQFDWAEFAFSPDGRLSVGKRVDLSREGEDLGELRIAGKARKVSASRYQVRLRVREPFFGNVETLIDTVPMRRTYLTEALEWQKQTPLDGTQGQDDENLLNHSLFAGCSLRVGPPFVRVR